jgi:hypothetical protein
LKPLKNRLMIKVGNKKCEAIRMCNLFKGQM